MSPFAIWSLIIVIGMITFALRLSGILVLGASSMSPMLTRILRYVPAAVLAAIVVPAVVHGGPDPGLHPENARLYAGVLAAAVAWTTRSVLATLFLGMSGLWFIEWWLAH